MDDTTLTALKESIEKWERRASGEHNLVLGTHSCPLCRLFHEEYRHDERDGCQGCPVFEKTGQKHCYSTPYLSYVDHPTDSNAQKELDFLKSLLPDKAAREKKESFRWVDLHSFS